MTISKFGSGGKWVPLALLAGVVVVGTFIGINSMRRTQATTSATTDVKSLPAGRSGPVGEVAITPEAMKLAEISIGSTHLEGVSEPLKVSGVIAVGGDQQAKVTPIVTGKVVSLKAGEGDEVSAGQVLATIDSPELAAAQATYSQANARVSARQATLKRQKQLAALGQFGGPSVENARKSLAEAERDMREAERIVATEQASQDEAEIQIPALESALEQSNTELNVRQKEYDRSKNLYDSGIISKREFERTAADFDNAKADVKVAESAVDQAKARVTGAKRRLAAAQAGVKSAQQRVKVAQDTLTREEKVFAGNHLNNREIVEAESALREAEVERVGAANNVRVLGGSPGQGSHIALRAPISGKIQERAITLGSAVDPEHHAFTIVNLNQVWAQLAVSPRDLPHIRVGDEVKLTSEATGDQVFTGSVASISPAADESTRSVFVRTTLNNPSKALKAGAYVKGQIQTDFRQDRVMVPESALQDHQGKPTLYVKLPGEEPRFEVRHVLLGINQDGKTEITAGIKEGEAIAISGTFYLKSEALKSELSDGCCAPGA